MLIATQLRAQDPFSYQLLTDDFSDISAIHATDIDEDGFLDLFIATFRTSNTTTGTRKEFKLVWRSNEDGNFASGGTLFNIFGGDQNGLDFAIHDQQFIDLDADGRTDVLTSNEVKTLGKRAKGFQWHRNIGGAEFDASTLDQSEFGPDFGRPLAWDGNGDSIQDILIVREGHLLRHPYSGRGQDKYGRADTLLTTLIDQVFSADVNGDDKADIVLYTNGMLFLYEGDGTGRINTTPQLLVSGLSADQLLLEDIDGDGAAELLSLTYASGITLYGNNGTGNFDTSSVIVSFPLPLADVQLALADLDNDDAIDLILSDNILGLQWLKNNGAGLFETVRSITQQLTTDFQVVDFDRDGDLDLVVALAGNEIVWFDNGIADSTATGVSQYTDSHHPGIAVYPNPVSIQSVLHFDRVPAVPYEIVLYDSRGKEAYRRSGLTGNDIKLTPDVPSGVYLLVAERSDDGAALGNCQLIIHSTE